MTHNQLLYFCRYGTWGICFTYGTLFAVKGLVAAGRTYDTSSSIRKACKFLLSKQQTTGGWGESYLSSETGVSFLSLSSKDVLLPPFQISKMVQIHLLYTWNWCDRSIIPLLNVKSIGVNMLFTTPKLATSLTHLWVGTTHMLLISTQHSSILRYILVAGLYGSNRYSETIIWEHVRCCL